MYVRQIIIILTASLIATSAFAQDKKPKLTGNPINDIKNAVSGSNVIPGTDDNKFQNLLAKPFQEMADFLASDAQEAIRLSTAVPGLKDGHGQQCWIAMSTAGAVFKEHPIPLTFRAMSDIEALRLLTMTANNLCSNAHCTQVFADLTNAAQAASPIPLPIPSLNSLCSKIPQIGIVDPVDIPAPVAPVVPQ